jgi:hypothetical protein
MTDDDVERRLRDAVAARSAAVTPTNEEAALESIKERVRGGPRRPPWLLAVAAVLVLVVAGVTFALTRSDTKTTVATPPGTESSSSSDAGPPAFAGIPVWPIDGTTFDSPTAVAQSFATDYLGMSAPSATVNGTDVAVRPNSNGPTTILQTAQTATGWIVVGATSDQVTVDRVDISDRAADLVSAPALLVISGSSTATEATVNVQVRPFGSVTPSVSQPTMGGANGEMGPYRADVAGPLDGVAVVGVPDLSGRGTFVAAAVKRFVLPPSWVQIADGPSMVGKSPDGSYVAIDSGAGRPVSQSEFDAYRRATEADIANAVKDLGSIPTRRSDREVALVEADGLTVATIDVLSGKRTELFKAQHKVVSLDANAAGGLIFTDDQTGLWRWDGPGQGPVQMTTGYVDAAW